MNAAALDAIRAEIDAVDDAILALAAKRSQLAQSISALKPADASALRPAREIALLRRLVANAPEGASPDLIVELWRALIAESVRRQGGIEVVVAAGADPLRSFDLARRHFGGAAKIVRVEDPRAALTRSLDHPTTVACLPWPVGSGAGGWWPILNERRYHTLSVFAVLPTRIEGAAEPECALVGQGVPLEPAGEDQTLAVAFDPQHKCARVLAEAGCVGREIARARETVLIRFDSFLAADHPVLTQMEAAGLDGLRVVGSYARI